MAPEVRILIIEDDEEDFFLISNLLATNEPEWTVCWAKSATEALDRCIGSHYDALLLDYRLGAFDTGTGLLRQLRERGDTTPTVFLTGYGDEEIAVLAMKSGAADYLPKSRLSGLGLSAALRYAMAVHRNPRLAVPAAAGR